MASDDTNDRSKLQLSPESESRLTSALMYDEMDRALLDDKGALAQIALTNFSNYDSNNDNALDRDELKQATEQSYSLFAGPTADVLYRNFERARSIVEGSTVSETQIYKTDFAKQKIEQAFGGDSISNGISRKDLEAMRVMSQFGNLSLLLDGVDQVDVDKVRRAHKHRGLSLDAWS